MKQHESKKKSWMQKRKRNLKRILPKSSRKKRE